ncbi:centrosomal protein kizuna [Caloenas nicobarica]|uniref:centrosomal protein kizuna n=1 Tax=Caloenas nicobarica TaxID=187106 RepID=UPI0032B87C5A
MSGPGAAAAGSSGPGLPPGTHRRRLRHSEAKRLELERKLMECIQSAYQNKMKCMKLKKYWKEIDERQKGALVRNQTFLKEFDQFEAHLKTSSLETIQKMEAWYGREIKRALSLQEGNLSAAGDKEEAAKEQVPQVGRPSGVSTRAAVLATGALGTLQKPLQPTESRSAPDLSLCSPSLEGLGPDSRSADLESGASAEGAASCGDPAAGEEGSEQLISSASNPKPAALEEERPRGSVPGPKPLLSTWWPREEASSAEPSVPVSVEDVIPWGTASPAAGGERGRDVCAAQGSPLHPPSLPSASSAPDGLPGTLAGLVRALQRIEDAALRSPQRRALYQGGHAGTVGTAELLSFCNRDGSLKDDDLEACEAAVLHQLRALFLSALNGCLPPEKTLHAEGRAVDEKQTRLGQREAAVLQTCLSNHALFLKKHQVQLPAEVAEMFERLLLSERAQDGQAVPVLREVLPEEHGDRSSAQSAESCRGSPSIPQDGGEPAAAKQAPRLAGSAGERGWGAGDNGSKAKESQEMRLETSSSSNERSPPFPRTETRKGMVTAIKSKAFWGESDDSSSEIEAALRPQSHRAEADEFDDFYD